ncbi:MAG: aldo/keto reductase [Clostridiales bacterium]|nr:aldo/keto reductase [Candidatus Apopatocola equi]
MNKMGFGFLRLPKTGEDYDWKVLNEMVDLFLQRGGRYFDTCYTYLNGNSELGLRRCLTERHSRDSYELAEKLPGYNCKSYEDCIRFFEEEQERCGVKDFDVYLLHWLNGKNYELAEKYDEFRFLRELKAKGLTKRIGFSYHDSASLLDRILKAHPEVDLVQLQLNYLDWESAGIQSRQCYETCVRHGKKVVVMEPIKGGTLANLPAEAEKLLRAARGTWSNAEWALRFVQSLPQVEICLSGMSSLSQVEENMREVEALTAGETELLGQVRSIIESSTAVPCTGCRYCESHCPQRIPIPDYFKMYNELCRAPGDGWKIRPSYLQHAVGRGRAADCMQCHSCEHHCPQNIKIADIMKKVAESLEA